MRYTSKKLPDSAVEIEVVLDHKEFLEYYQPVYDQAFSSVQLKGFRPGAAPKDLADKAIDKEKVFNEAAVRATRDSLKEITAENNWQVIDQPAVEVLETNPQTDIGLKFKVSITIFPEVKLGNYQKIAKKILGEKKTIEVEEKEIEEAIKWILNSRAKLTRVNKIAEKGDILDIDFAGFADGQALDRTSGKADSFVLGDGKFIPGFEENLLGHKESDAVEFSVTFPGDYWKEDMRNKKVDFKVNIHGVFHRELPELTDEFVKTFGKFETVGDLRKSIKDGITKEKSEKEKERVRLKIIDGIIKDSKIELPQIMVDRTLNNMVAEYKAMVRSAVKEDENQLRQRLEERAKNDVATNLVLYKIAKEQNLEPTPKETEEEANKLLAHSEFSRNPKIDQQKVYDYSYGVVQNRKVFEFLESSK